MDSLAIFQSRSALRCLLKGPRLRLLYFYFPRNKRLSYSCVCTRYSLRLKCRSLAVLKARDLACRYHAKSHDWKAALAKGKIDYRYARRHEVHTSSIRGVIPSLQSPLLTELPREFAILLDEKFDRTKTYDVNRLVD